MISPSAQFSYILQRILLIFAQYIAVYVIFSDTEGLKATLMQIKQRRKKLSAAHPAPTFVRREKKNRQKSSYQAKILFIVCALYGNSQKMREQLNCLVKKPPLFHISQVAAVRCCCNQLAKQETTQTQLLLLLFFLRFKLEAQKGEAKLRRKACAAGAVQRKVKPNEVSR